jgi:hypothetical protein
MVIKKWDMAQGSRYQKGFEGGFTADQRRKKYLAKRCTENLLFSGHVVRPTSASVGG